MIFKSSCCLKISGVCPINKSSHPNLPALSMRMLGLLQDNYSRHSTNMSNKTSQRVFSVQPRRETFIIPLLQSRGDVTCLLKSRCFGCWLTDLWNIQGWYGRTEKRLCVWPTVLFPLMDSLCVLQQECSHRPKNSYNKYEKRGFHIYQWVFYEDITLVECVE